MTLDHEQHAPAARVADRPPVRRRPAPWIVADGLTKRFGSHVAVDGLSFDVPRGVVTGFLGPNGSGKTTTMRMILGLVRPTAGTATVAGRPFRELAHPGREVGVVIDGAAAHPRRTGRDHLRVLAAERGVTPARVGHVLESVELTEAAGRRVGEYSLGMRQRLHLAAALLGEPAALMLDEPGNGLDPAGVRWLRDFLTSYATAGGTVLVSSHQLDEMSRLADDVVVVDRGRLVAQTSVGQLTSGRSVKVVSPQAADIARAVVRDGGRVLGVDGTTLHLADVTPEAVGAISLRLGALLHELSPQHTALEDVFLELTHDGGHRS